MRFPFISMLSLFMIIPAALGSIDISLEQDYFNIGDSIRISSSIDAEKSMSAFMRFTAVCGSFSIPYFLTPIDVQEGFRTQVDAPQLKVTSAMRGQCAIKAELVDEEGEVADAGLSRSFSVSDGLEIVLVTEDMTALPASSKKIEGIVRGAGGKIANADIVFTFDGQDYAASTFNGKFIVMLDISGTAKTGKHPIGIVAQDMVKNKGSTTGEIDVIAVPSQLEISVQPEAQNPGSEITYTATVTDQAGELIDDAIGLTIIQPDNLFMFKGEAKSGQQETYTLGQYAAPGEHVVSASYHNLGAQAKFTINTIKDIKLEQQGESVFVENIGNVLYEEEVPLIIEGDEKSYSINEKVKLDPGEVGMIELGKEVPYGYYTVLAPQPAAELFDENSSTEENMVLAENVEIHDERSALKRAGSGVKGITGNIVGSDGIITRNGWVAPIILVGVVIVIGLYYTRDIWLLMMMRRK